MTTSADVDSQTVTPNLPAVQMVVTEDFLNTLASHATADGVETSPSRHTVNVPFMGAIELSVGMTIVGVRFSMSGRHPDRLLATVTVRGRVEVLGEFATDTPLEMTLAGTMLVEPIVVLDPERHVRVVLDVPNCELVGVSSAADDEPADDPVGQMLLAALGDGFFGDLARALGEVGLDLDAEVAAFAEAAGLYGGRARVVVDDGLMTVEIGRRSGIEGEAPLLAVEDGSMGVGVASGVLNAGFLLGLEAQLGRPLPFQFDVDTRDSRVVGQVRSPRLVEHPLLPDLRAALRGGVRVVVRDRHVDLELSEAWLRLPALPGASVFNRFSRALGGLAGQLPVRVTVPRRIPLTAASSVAAGELAVHVDHIDITRGGVWCVVSPSLD